VLGQILPHQSPKDETKVDVDIMVIERPMKSVDLEMEWALVPGRNNKPVLAHPIPGTPTSLPLFLALFFSARFGNEVDVCTVNVLSVYICQCVYCQCTVTIAQGIQNM
jgi:hypothetical protein